MCALISGLREAEMRWGAPPINAATLCSEDSQDFTSSKLLKPVGTQLFFLPFQIWTNGYFPTAMRGHFSIEWMAQSSQSAGTDVLSGPAACGTHSESLPGFYCRQRSENVPEASRNQSLKTFNQHQISHGNQGKHSSASYFFCKYDRNVQIRLFIAYCIYSCMYS